MLRSIGHLSIGHLCSDPNSKERLDASPQRAQRRGALRGEGALRGGAQRGHTRARRRSTRRGRIFAGPGRAAGVLAPAECGGALEVRLELLGIGPLGAHVCVLVVLRQLLQLLLPPVPFSLARLVTPSYWRVEPHAATQLVILACRAVRVKPCRAVCCTQAASAPWRVIEHRQPSRGGP